MSGLLWYLLPLWPLIFWRIQRLKAWLRQAGGPGSQMLWGVMRNGRVVLIRESDDLAVHSSCSFRAPVSARLRVAVKDATPPCVRRMPAQRAILSAIVAAYPGFRRERGFTIHDT